MAMATYLQMVSLDELAALERDPSGINALDQPVWTKTYLGASINDFVTGSAYPEPDAHALATMLSGSRSIKALTLENGALFITDPADAPKIVAALKSLDRAALRTAIEAADFSELVDEEELYELEVMSDDEVVTTIMKDLDSLQDFYARVAEAGAAVVSYTT